jgi:hypothetical protein
MPIRKAARPHFVRRKGKGGVTKTFIRKGKKPVFTKPRKSK